MPTKHELKDAVVEKLKTVFDPEIPVNIHALGLIYDVTVDDAGHAHILMTLTAPNCPAAGVLPAEVEYKAKLVEGITSAKVEITFDPPWSKDMMSEAALLELGLM